MNARRWSSTSATATRARAPSWTGSARGAAPGCRGRAVQRGRAGRPQRGHARRAAPHLRPVRLGHVPRRAHPPVPVHGGRPARRWPPRPTTWPRRRAGPVRPAHRRRRRAARHAVPPGRQPGPGDGAAAADRHGSCGMGIGETMAYALAHPADAPRVADACRPGCCGASSRVLRDRLTDELGPLDAPPVDATWRTPSARSPRGVRSSTVRSSAAAAAPPGPVRLRGRAGRAARRVARLPPVHDLVHDDVRQRADAAGRGGPVGALRLGVVRTYTTRHGAGPLVTEDPALPLPEPHNPTDRVAGRVPGRPLRRGRPPLRGRGGGGVDGLALTHLDVVAPALRICPSYDWTDRLMPGPAGDLDRQEALTRRLFSTRPALRARAGRLARGGVGGVGHAGRGDLARPDGRRTSRCSGRTGLPELTPQQLSGAKPAEVHQTRGRVVRVGLRVVGQPVGDRLGRADQGVRARGQILLAGLARPGPPRRRSSMPATTSTIRTRSAARSSANGWRLLAWR